MSLWTKSSSESRPRRAPEIFRDLLHAIDDEVGPLAADLHDELAAEARDVAERSPRGHRNLVDVGERDDERRATERSINAMRLEPQGVALDREVTADRSQPRGHPVRAD